MSPFEGQQRLNEALADDEVELVGVSRPHADALLEAADNHLESAATLVESDPDGAYSLLYAASRKAFTAILSMLGYRPTSKGGHIVLERVVGGFLGVRSEPVRAFSIMRRRRNQSEYPYVDTPPIQVDEVQDLLPKAKDLVDKSRQAVQALASEDR